MKPELLEFKAEIECTGFEFYYRNCTLGSGHLTDTDITAILSNGHTARGILVYVFRNWLNFPEKQEWIVEIHDTGALILDNKSKSKRYLFHAVKVKNKEEIKKEINKYRDLKISHHFFAVLDKFKTLKKVSFYEGTEGTKELA